MERPAERGLRMERPAERELRESPSKNRVGAVERNCVWRDSVERMEDGGAEGNRGGVIFKREY